MGKRITILLAVILISSCLTVKQHQKIPPSNSVSSTRIADKIYINGNIITVDPNNTIAEAVALYKGNILYVGTNEEIQQFRSDTSEVVDLQGKTMLPGFYDGHSHIAIYSMQKEQGVYLAPPPIGNITSIDEIVERLKNYIKQKNIPKGQIVYGPGYSDIGLKQHRHPNRYDLDRVSTEHFILIRHYTLHFSVINSYAINKLNISRDTPEFNEGNIAKNQDGEPTGLLKEKEQLIILPYIPKLKLKSLMQGIQDYISVGITTAQQGSLYSEAGATMIANDNQIPIDIISYYIVFQPDQLPNYYKMQKQQKHHMTIPGIKFVLDGSIQGYTAYLSKPYFNQKQFQQFGPHDGKYETNNESINKFTDYIIQNNIDGVFHCNGDAAADQLIDSVRKSKLQYKGSTNRITVIHAQTLRQDQLDQMKILQMTPSFFISHTYYWGDMHFNIFLGPERARNLDPTAWAVNRNMIFSLHNDSPVIPMLPNGVFHMIWCAVNRLTLTNRSLGEEHRLSVMQAIRAVTINSAWQGREEHRKGSIQPGKMADLIIVSQNPLTIDKFKLKDIAVLQTIKEGRSIYRASESEFIAKNEQAHIQL